MITNVVVANGIPQETVRGILQNFVDYLKHKYGPIQTDNECLAQMMNARLRTAEAP